MDNSKQQDQSSKNIATKEAEEAPKYGIEEGKGYTLDAQQQSGQQAMPARGLDEQYNLEDYYQKNDEEMAKELAVNDFNQLKTPDDNKDNRVKAESKTDSDTNAKTGIGWLAVILSVLAFFMMPILLGAVGIITGFVAKNRGADTLGNTAIAAGAIAIAVRLLIAPFV